MHLYTTDIPLHMYSQPELTEYLKLKQQAYLTAESHSQELNRTIEKILPKMSLVLYIQNYKTLSIRSRHIL